MCAIFSNQLEKVCELLDSGVDVNSPDCTLSQESPLARAALDKKTAIVKELLKRGADINITKENGDTPLHAACHSKHMGILQLLLENGALVNVRGLLGRTPLYLATANENTKAVRLLLDHNANPDTKADYDDTPLVPAAANGNIRILEMLLEAHNYNTDLNRAFRMAAAYDQVNSMKKLLEYDADPNLATSGKKTALYYAKRNGKENSISFLESLRFQRNLLFFVAKQLQAGSKPQAQPNFGHLPLEVIQKIAIMIRR